MSTAGNKRRSACGFSLIELVVVLTIITLATIAIASALPRLGKHSALQTSAVRLAQMISQARMRAISMEKTTVVSLDSTMRRYWLAGTRKTATLPDPVAFQWRDNAQRMNIRFFPDGSADSANLALSDGEGQVTMSVSPVTGSVVVR